MKKAVFIIPPTVELLDLAGPVQVFTEAKFYGYEIALEFYTYQQDPVSTCGLTFGRLSNYLNAQLEEGDLVFVPGMAQLYVRSAAFRKEQKFFRWLKTCADRNVRVCSVCNGAFALGEAGLLSDLECTTHWRRVEELQKQFPQTKVVPDVFYVKNHQVCTSAGISAGIDLALSILEEMTNIHFTHKVARGLVVYYRGNGKRTHQPEYLDFRNHIHPKIHEIQDYLIDHLQGENSLAELAPLVGMSPRNLTRLFKDTTGATIKEYLTQVRIDKAKSLLQNPKKNLSAIAAECGFKTERQLQRILKN